MRAVADTNTVISGLFWGGAPRLVLDAAREEKITLFSSYALLGELEEVLCRPKFADLLTAAGTTPRELTLGYASLVEIVEPAELAPIVVDDPDDDAVLACAVAADARVIVSGDQHLLNIKQYASIRIVTAADAMALLHESIQEGDLDA